MEVKALIAVRRLSTHLSVDEVLLEQFIKLEMIISTKPSIVTKGKEPEI